MTIPSTQPISMTVSLDPGQQVGVRHDWWILVQNSSGNTFSWIRTGDWISGIQRAYDGHLTAVNDFSVHYGTIPVGTWLIAFAVDELNNVYEGTYLDTISVTCY